MVYTIGEMAKMLGVPASASSAKATSSGCG